MVWHVRIHCKTNYACAALLHATMLLLCTDQCCPNGALQQGPDRQLWQPADNVPFINLPCLLVQQIQPAPNVPEDSKALTAS
jgi:hypothetical protein